MAEQTSSQSPPGEDKLDKGLRQAGATIKIIFFAMALSYVALHWTFLSEWISTITHGEVFGIKFDREAADQKVKEIIGSKTIKTSSPTFAKGAVARAARVGSAVAGARVLWLDTNLENNLLERQVLEAMNISVHRALSVDAAKKLAEQAAKDGEPYDLIISNVGKDTGQGPLTKCPVHFSEVPKGLDPPWTRTLPEYNAEQNKTPRGGFAFAEWLATEQVTANVYMQTQRPKLIF